MITPITPIPTLQPTPQGIEFQRLIARALAGERAKPSSFQGTPVFTPWTAAADAGNKMFSALLARDAAEQERQMAQQSAGAALGVPGGGTTPAAGITGPSTIGPTSSTAPLSGDLSDAAIRLSTLGETGSPNIDAKTLAAIAPDANKSKSYGPFGLNSWKGSAGQFAQAHPELGLTALPGSTEFDKQWKDAVANNTDAMIAAHRDWHSKNILPGITEQLTQAGIDPQVAGDPRTQLYMADRKLQMGNAGLQPALSAAKGARSPEEFINAVSAADKKNVGTNFRTYLKDHPNDVPGLHNRIDLRSRGALNYQPVSSPAVGLPISPSVVAAPGAVGPSGGSLTAPGGPVRVASASPNVAPPIVNRSLLATAPPVAPPITAPSMQSIGPTSAAPPQGFGMNPAQLHAASKQLMASGNNAQAKALLQQVTQQNPTDAGAWHRLGMLDDPVFTARYGGTPNPQKAVIAYRIAAELGDPRAAMKLQAINQVAGPPGPAGPQVAQAGPMPPAVPQVGPVPQAAPIGPAPAAQAGMAPGLAAPTSNADLAQAAAQAEAASQARPRVFYPDRSQAAPPVGQPPMGTVMAPPAAQTFTGAPGRPAASLPPAPPAAAPPMPPGALAGTVGSLGAGVGPMVGPPVARPAPTAPAVPTAPVPGPVPPDLTPFTERMLQPSDPDYVDPRFLAKRPHYDWNAVRNNWLWFTPEQQKHFQDISEAERTRQPMKYDLPGGGSILYDPDNPTIQRYVPQYQHEPLTLPGGLQTQRAYVIKNGQKYYLPTAAQNAPGVAPQANIAPGGGYLTAPPLNAPTEELAKWAERNQIEMEREKATAGELAKARSEPVKSAIVRGSAAPDVIRSLDVIETLANDPNAANINTGPFAEQFLRAKQALNDFFPGMDLGKEVGPAEAIQKMNAFLASSSTHELTPRSTQFDFSVFMKNNPGLSQSRQGRRMVADILRQMAVQDKMYGEAAQSLDNPKDLYKVRDEIYKRYPIQVTDAAGRPLVSAEPVPEFQSRPGQVPVEIRHYAPPTVPGTAPVPTYTLGQTATIPKTGQKFIFTKDGWREIK